MFEGFDSRTVPGEGADIHLRVGGAGPPLLLLHGHPQTSARWHKVAPGLAERHTGVAALVRGRGRPWGARPPIPARGVAGGDPGRPGRVLQGLSRTSRTARSLYSVSAHSASGSEPGTMPAPASRWARWPSRVAQRRAIAHSPSPVWSTQPTGPA